MLQSDGATLTLLTNRHSGEHGNKYGSAVGLAGVQEATTLDFCKFCSGSNNHTNNIASTERQEIVIEVIF